MFSLPDSLHIPFVFGLILAATVMMASNRVRYDMIALLMVLALMLSGILTVSEALAGFGNSVVILIAALLVIGEMLDRTGVARSVGDWILTKGGKSEVRLLALIMLSSAVLSAIMSSTAVVAIFIPVILRIAMQTGLNPSKLLLPMSYAALVSGMLTLIATPPNLVISGELEAKGFAPLGFFSFAPLGLLVLVLSMLYLIGFGRRWLPDQPRNPSQQHYGRSLRDLWEDYRVNRETTPLRVQQESPLCQQPIGTCGLHQNYGVRILEVVRPQRGGSDHFPGPSADFVLHAGDILLVAGQPDLTQRMMQAQHLSPHRLSRRDEQRSIWELGAVSVLIHPNSKLIGHSIVEAGFRSHYGLDVMGLRRNQTAIVEFEQEKLAASDSLLVVGPWSRINKLQAQNHDFVLLESPLEARDVVPAHQRMPIAILITLAMVVASLFNWIPLVATVMIAALASVVTRCLSAQDAYRSIHWSSLVLLAGMLPLADALQKTGGTHLIVDSLLLAVGDASPAMLLTVLFFVTVLLTNILSNTTSAVLMAPIALGVAEAIGVSPYPLAVAVLLAASSAFLTPVASPVVTLVVEPGHYRFSDFAKLGSVMVLMVYAVTLLLVPLLFPW
ncbi:SLC13 family permease [Ketobacter sp.]|uniref:SLC13 family permease n=1 Tax=Ketobacter sp. TaxID=2083498 RepID=UPI000F1ECCC4|nr:SLC13 family permease [Ketobacter sp.]RLT99390.1 MAG: TRAP transporter large permease subunit [Ketobacter sp.]